MGTLDLIFDTIDNKIHDHHMYGNWISKYKRTYLSLLKKSFNTFIDLLLIQYEMDGFVYKTKRFKFIMVTDTEDQKYVNIYINEDDSVPMFTVKHRMFSDYREMVAILDASLDVALEKRILRHEAEDEETLSYFTFEEKRND